MSNWELVMPGGGLSAIGLAGIVLSYAGLAHTFIDGMHALSGLLFFIGLIFLGAGILDGGVSTSNRTKATVLVTISIILTFGAGGFIGSESTTLPTVAGLLIMVSVPGIVIAYMAMKMPQYVKPVGLIFIFAIALGITVFFGFGILGPTGYLLPEVVEEAVEDIVQEVPEGEIFAISILAGSSEQGNPDYDPDVATLEKGDVIQWTNDDVDMHTVTSSLDFGETFDSGLLNANEKFLLDSGQLSIGSYEYMCIVHPWMVASIVIEEPVE
jgi:plastocyanin